MKLLSLLLLTIAAPCRAQTAPGFPLTVSSPLTVTYLETNTSVTPPGVLLPRDRVLSAPSVARPANASVNATYLLLLIDQDVPLNSTAKTTLLHWFAPNLTSTADNSTLRLTNAASAPAGGAPVGAPYQSPTPPAGSGPHRYTFVLFAQPANFSVPASYGNVNPPNESSARRGFNVTDFVGASGLAAPLAANYLRVLNGTAEETSSAIPTTGTMVMTGSATASASATAGSSASTAGAAEGWGTGGSVGSWLLGAVGALLWMV